jgi:hypothetical protein
MAGAAYVVRAALTEKTPAHALAAYRNSASGLCVKTHRAWRFINCMVMDLPTLIESAV